MADTKDLSLEAQGIYPPTPEDIEDARTPRDTLWKKLTSSTAARALIVAVSGLGAINGIGHLLGPSETPANGAYDYAVTQVENGTRYTREHVTGVYQEGLLSTMVQKNVQVITVSPDRADITFSVGIKNENYFAGRKVSEEDLGSRFITPGPVSLGTVGDQTAAFYSDANALNNQIYAVKGAEAALNQIPAIEAKREKYAETIRIIEEEQGGSEQAWLRLAKYTKLAETAEKNGVAAFFLEHGKVMTQQDMDSIIKAGDTMGWRIASGEVVPMKDAVTVLPEKGTFTAIDGKEFAYTNQTELMKQVAGHYRQAADTLAPHLHRYTGADNMGGIPGPVAPDKVEEAKKTINDFTINYGTYELAEQKVGDLFRQDTLRLSESFAQKAQRTPAPAQELYHPYLLTPQDHKKIEADGNSVSLLLPQSRPSHVTITVAPKGITNK